MKVEKDDLLGMVKKDCYYLKDIEGWGIFDVIRYDKKALQLMTHDFFNTHSRESLEKRMKEIRVSDKFI